MRGTGPLYSCADQSLEEGCPGKGHNFGQGTLKEGLAEDCLLAALPAAGRIDLSVLKVNLGSVSQNQLSNEIWEPFRHVYSFFWGKETFSDL